MRLFVLGAALLVLGLVPTAYAQRGIHLKITKPKPGDAVPRTFPIEGTGDNLLTRYLFAVLINPADPTLTPYPGTAMPTTMTSWRGSFTNAPVADGQILRVETEPEEDGYSDEVSPVHV